MTEAARLDERAVSWKVLLPCQADSSVLAVGLDQASVVGLARSYKGVHTKLTAGTQYDAVVIGHSWEGSVINLTSLLKPNGVIVDASQNWKMRAALMGAGFRHCAEYAALPAERPRLFVPLASRRLRSRALHLHVPGSAIARVGLVLASGLSSLGIKRHLVKRSVSLHAREEKALNRGSLLEWVSARLGYPLLALVVFTGSDAPRRKITALAIAANQQNDVIVKIADTDLGAIAIGQESQALRAVGNSDLSEQVPKMIAEGRWNDYCVQVQERESS